jgi:hypothetical protein
MPKITPTAPINVPLADFIRIFAAVTYESNRPASPVRRTGLR